MTTQRSGGSGAAPFAGKTAIVTGGASGIGKAIAAELIAQGARVTVADIDHDAVQVAAHELGDDGNACTLDTRDEDAFRACDRRRHCTACASAHSARVRSRPRFSTARPTPTSHRWHRRR
jgi:NAD(P)-dependent dehydrogenase (short-subunit alcohol dehydrogenase family)